jgi:hypothetical protein
MSTIEFTAQTLPELPGVTTGAHRAMRAVAWARRKDLLPHPTEHACVDCGKTAQVYDHRDYGRPLDVVPVCRACNAKRGTAAAAESDDPIIQFETEGSGYVLSKFGIAPVSFLMIDFYPIRRQNKKR